MASLSIEQPPHATRRAPAKTTPTTPGDNPPAGANAIAANFREPAERPLRCDFPSLQAPKVCSPIYIYR